MEKIDEEQIVESMLRIAIELSREIKKSTDFLKVNAKEVEYFEHSLTEELRIELDEIIEELKFKLALKEAQSLLEKISNALFEHLENLSDESVVILYKRFKSRGALLKLISSIE